MKYDNPLMLKHSCHILLCIWMLLSTGLGAFAQASPQHQEALHKAQLLLLSSKNDSALIYLEPVFEQLEKQGLTDSPFGLSVQLITSTALAHDGRDIKAMSMLHSLSDKSKALGAWEIYAGTCLALAELHEKLGRFNAMKAALENARTTIARHSLDSLYPAFSVRLASWFKIYGFADSTRYYAFEAVKMSKKYGLPAVAAEAYHLLGREIENRDLFKAVEYYRKAVECLKTDQDYLGLSHEWYTISLLFLRNDRFNESLIYNDSTIMACYKAIANGTDQLAVLHMAYQNKGRAYESLGILDSSVYYLKKGFTQEISFVQQEERYRVVEVDERYKDEQKNLKLEKQTEELSYGRQRLLGLLLIAGLILFSAAVLVYYYLRLKKANRLTLEQANTIKDTNEQLTLSLERQIMLQGEIHHRVKNNLQVIISLLELQKDDIADPATRDSLDAMATRIFSMAAVHDVLYQKEGEQVVDFLLYTRKLCDHLSMMTTREKPLFNLKIPQQFFNLETLMPLGIMLNELLTNSLKYAWLADQQLQINVLLKPHKDGFQLQYKDNGPGFLTGKLTDREGGLGAYLIRSMSRQLNGTLETKNIGGAAYVIYFEEKNRAA